MNPFQSFLDEILKEVQCRGETKEDLREELNTHLEMLLEEYLEQGYPLDEAVQLAISTFGSPQSIGNELHKTIFYYNKKETKIFPRKLIAVSLTASLMTMIISFLFYPPFSLELILQDLSVATSTMLSLFSILFIYGIPFSILIEFLVRRFKPKYPIMLTGFLYLLFAIITTIFQTILMIITLDSPEILNEFAWDTILLPVICALMFWLIDEWLQKHAYEKYFKLLVTFSIGFPIIFLFTDWFVEWMFELILK